MSIKEYDELWKECEHCLKGFSNNQHKADYWNKEIYNLCRNCFYLKYAYYAKK